MSLCKPAFHRSQWERWHAAVVMIGLTSGAAMFGTAGPMFAAGGTPSSGGAGAAASAAPTEGAISATPVRFADLPGWQEDDHASAFAAFLRSCGKIVAAAERTAPKSATPAAAAASALPDRPAINPPALKIGQGALLDACRKAMARAANGKRAITRTEARVFFEHLFVPHRVVHAGSRGLLTGYYEPEIEGSRVATARFKVPLYRRPADLENVVAETERGAGGITYTHMRRTAQGLVPYPTRTDIEAGALKGQGLELIWLTDPVDAFFLQVQGSGNIRFPDGTSARVTYDGKNGHPYSSIGRYLIDQKVMGADSMTLDRLGAYLRADETRGRAVMQVNASFVFFRELAKAEGERALGAMSIGLTPGRSLAVDASVHTLGVPIFVVSPTLKHHTGGKRPFQRLMVAQDVGSAIRGPERGDIYFGSGAKAGALAGVTKQPGQFYVLLPRPAAAAQTPQ